MALAALLVVSFTIPAWAMENQFGGLFRFRGWTAQNMTGDDFTEGKDVSAVALRARLYYTAVFQENLKFVTKFEMDTAYGSNADKGSKVTSASNVTPVDSTKDVTGTTNAGGWGDIGADGTNLEVKNAYIDFNVGPVNSKVGVYYTTLARGFLFADDHAGITVNFKGDNVSIPFIWIKAYEGGRGKDRNDYDVDYYGFAPSFNIGGNVTINPYGLYAYSKDASGWGSSASLEGKATEELNLWYAGLDIDANFDMVKIWATGIYQGGDVDFQDKSTADFAAWLAAVGFGVNMSWGDVHGQVFYATGDDGKDADIENFFVPQGQSYYWGEIMGFGDLGDNYYLAGSNHAPNDQIGNIMAANFGVSVKPSPALKIALDVWYAALAEDMTYIRPNGTTAEESYLGTEVDLKITYELVKGLNLDIIGAYLFAGDLTTEEKLDEADPYEVGTMLSLSF